MIRAFPAATTLAALALAALAAGCATPAAGLPPDPDVPAALAPPAGQQAYLALQANGVQIYECARKPDAADAFAWQFRAPEATLADASGQVVGRHFAGPSWASDDGSTITGKAAATAPAPEAGAIPWLLLAVKSHEGHGVLDAAASVQRVHTTGGVAPTAPCGAANEHATERVGYLATYVFWRQ